MKPALRWTLCVLAIVVLLDSPARACNIPVFRYALERWAADPYEVLVFQRGPLDGAARQALDLLEQEPRGNVTVTSVDLDDSPDVNLVKLFKRESSPTLPWMMVRYPLATGIGATVWSGALTADSVKQINDSPVRQELAKRLLAGQTAVWVFLESGNKEKDDAAFKLIEQELVELPKSMKLPELTETPADELLGKQLPLKISFSTMRLSRQQAGEAAFIKMLLLSEADLDKYADQPMVFPVFGRARALYALIGKGINHDNITQAGDFLVGPCSCEIKRLNPGVDLLVRADWEEFIRERLVKDKQPALVGLTTPPKEPMPSPPARAPDEVAELIPAPALVVGLSAAPRQPAEAALTETAPWQLDHSDADSRTYRIYRNMAIALGAALTLIGLTVLAFKGKLRP